MTGWDHPDTARYYEEFCRVHTRYREANETLVRHAAIEPGHRVLDFAAGLGGTAEAVLPHLDGSGLVLCVEPAGHMRRLGQRRLQGDPRVQWTAELPCAPAAFDRILCGAAIWQVSPLDSLFRRLHALLGAGGVLCFNIPSLYLGQPDDPGSGDDPHLLRLAAVLAEGHCSSPSAPASPLSHAGIEKALAAAGFRPHRWTALSRLTYPTYRDWMKIPVITDRLLAGVRADDRAVMIDAAFLRVDASSWRWEGWTGWTAWNDDAFVSD